MYPHVPRNVSFYGCTSGETTEGEPSPAGLHTDNSCLTTRNYCAESGRLLAILTPRLPDSCRGYNTVRRDSARAGRDWQDFLSA